MVKQKHGSMDCFSPQKWKVNACYVWPGYSVQVHWHSALLAQQAPITSPPCKGKELWITQNCMHPYDSACELLHMHLFVFETDWLYLKKEYKSKYNI